MNGQIIVVKPYINSSLSNLKVKYASIYFSLHYIELMYKVE